METEENTALGGAVGDAHTQQMEQKSLVLILFSKCFSAAAQDVRCDAEESRDDDDEDDDDGGDDGDGRAYTCNQTNKRRHVRVRANTHNQHKDTQSHLMGSQPRFGRLHEREKVALSTHFWESPHTHTQHTRNTQANVYIHD